MEWMAASAQRVRRAAGTLDGSGVSAGSFAPVERPQSEAAFKTTVLPFFCEKQNDPF